jgi:hypothetical protein
MAKGVGAGELTGDLAKNTANTMPKKRKVAPAAGFNGKLMIIR